MCAAAYGRTDAHRTVFARAAAGPAEQAEAEIVGCRALLFLHIIFILLVHLLLSFGAKLSKSLFWF